MAWQDWWRVGKEEGRPKAALRAEGLRVLMNQRDATRPNPSEVARDENEQFMKERAEADTNQSIRSLSLVFAPRKSRDEHITGL